MPAFLCYSQRMASIQISSNAATVTLTPPDEDGDYGWTCSACLMRYEVQPLADAIEDAEVHVDIYHESEN